MPLTLVFATDLLSHARDQHVNKQQGGEGHITFKILDVTHTVRNQTVNAGKATPLKKRTLPKLKTTHQLPLFCVTPTCTDESNTRRGFPHDARGPQCVCQSVGRSCVSQPLNRHDQEPAHNESKSKFSWSANTWFCVTLVSMMTASLIHLLVAYQVGHDRSSAPKSLRDTDRRPAHLHPCARPLISRGPTTLCQMHRFPTWGGASQHNQRVAANVRETAQQRLAREAALLAMRLHAEGVRKQETTKLTTGWRTWYGLLLGHLANEVRWFCECATESDTWPRASDWA